MTINDSSGDNSDTETTGSARASTVIEYTYIGLYIHALDCIYMHWMYVYTCIVHALNGIDALN